VRVHHEIEHSYEPPETGTELPDLTALAGVEEMAFDGRAVLEAVYYDTDDLDLAAAGVTLRRRSGGRDAGWHLKLPRGAGRDELQLPLSAGNEPPRSLTEAVLAWTRDKTLHPVAVIRTERTTYRLTGLAGQPGELVDDRVSGRVLRHSRDEVTWREWEFEIVDGEPGLLDEADALMLHHGVPLAAAQRKLLRVLGPDAPRPPRVPQLSPHSRAHEIVHTRLRSLVLELKVHDSEIRRDADGGIHATRVTLRRLRGTLGTYRRLLDRDVADPLRAELRWACRELGAARDAEVVHDLVVDVVETQQRPQTALAQVDSALRELRVRTDAGGLAVLTTVRYYALLESLDALVAEPPWRGRAERRADRVLPRLLARELTRLRQSARAAKSALKTRDNLDEAMHDTRKHAKRVRYAAETLEPAFGRPASDIVRAAKDLSAILGDRHDCVVARDRLAILDHDADPEVSAALRSTRKELKGRVHELDHEFHAAYRRLRRAGAAWIS
jgi:CHAD domain-containing protein